MFVDSTTCGSYYYQLDGKPLLGMMFNSYAQKQDWLNYETKLILETLLLNMF